MARTHRGKRDWPGKAVAFGLLQHLEAVAARTGGDRARIACNTKVTLAGEWSEHAPVPEFFSREPKSQMTSHP